MALHLYPHSSKSATLSDGTKYAWISIAPKTPSKPTLLLLHGFPSSSYDWRKVIPLFQKEGYGIIAPDMLGYGDTDKPEDVSKYSFVRMAAHLPEIVKLEGVEGGKVVGIGHDHGCGILSFAIVSQPQLFSKVVFTSVGYTPPATFDLDAYNKLTESALGYPVFGYWYFFNENDAGKVLDSHPDSVESLTYPEHSEYWKTTLAPVGAAKKYLESGTTTGLPAWLSKKEAETHEKVFKKGGYTAPLNWYKSLIRNIDKPFNDTLTDDKLRISVPTLLVLASEDYVCVPDLQKPAAQQYASDLRIETVGTGHWVPLEAPEEFAGLVTGFVRE